MACVDKSRAEELKNHIFRSLDQSMSNKNGIVVDKGTKLFFCNVFVISVKDSEKRSICLVARVLSRQKLFLQML